MKRKYLLSYLVAAAAIASGSAQAVIFTQDNLTVYTGAVNGTEDAAWNSTLNLGAIYAYDQFEGLATAFGNGDFAGPYHSASTSSGITFTDNGGSNEGWYAVSSTGAFSSLTQTGEGDDLAVFGDGAITITPPVGSNYTAFGLDLGGLDGGTTFNAEFTFDGGLSGLGLINQTLTPNPTATFFGVTSTSIISSVKIIPLTGHLSLDNVGFAIDGGEGGVPEPSSIALLGLGLAALSFSRRKAKAV